MAQNKVKVKLSSSQKNILKKQGIILMYLYGSQAEGRARKNSDIDIALLTDQKKQKHQEKIYDQISKILAPIFKPIPKVRELDIKFMDELTASVKHQIALDGQLLFKQTDDDRMEFIKQALRAYEHTKHLRQIKNYYLEQRIKKGIFAHPTPIPLKLYE